MKINNSLFYEQFKDHIPDLKFSINDPDVYIIGYNQKFDSSIMGTGNSNELDLSLTKKAYKALINQVFDFFDNHEGKALLIYSNAVFILLDHLLPNKELYVSQRHDSPHELKSLKTGNKYTVESSHEYLLDSAFITPKFICDPAVSNTKQYVFRVPEYQMDAHQTDEIEVFTHVFKSITFCVPDLLHTDTDINFVKEVLNISKNHIIC